MYNSPAKFCKQQPRYSFSMSELSSFRPSKLTDAEREAAEKLSQRFARLKSETGMTKAAFAREFEVPGGPSMISQNCSGNRPISLAQAQAYMRGFNCSLAEIAPYLAEAVGSTLTSHSSRELAARLATADATTRKLVEIALLENDESALSQLSPSLVAMVRGVKAVIAAQGNQAE